MLMTKFDDINATNRNYLRQYDNCELVVIQFMKFKLDRGASRADLRIGIAQSYEWPSGAWTPQNKKKLKKVLDNFLRVG